MKERTEEVAPFDPADLVDTELAAAAPFPRDIVGKFFITEYPRVGRVLARAEACESHRYLVETWPGVVDLGGEIFHPAYICLVYADDMEEQGWEFYDTREEQEAAYRAIYGSWPPPFCPPSNDPYVHDDVLTDAVGGYATVATTYGYAVYDVKDIEAAIEKASKK